MGICYIILLKYSITKAKMPQSPIVLNKSALRALAVRAHVLHCTALCSVPTRVSHTGEIRTCGRHCRDTESRARTPDDLFRSQHGSWPARVQTPAGMRPWWRVGPRREMTSWQIWGVKLLTLGHRFKNNDPVYLWFQMRFVEASSYIKYLLRAHLLQNSTDGQLNPLFQVTAMEL